MPIFDIPAFIPYEDNDARVVVTTAEDLPCLLGGIYSIRSHINLDRSNLRYFAANGIPDADRVPRIIYQAVHPDIAAYVALHTPALLLLTYQTFMARIKEKFLPTRWETEYAYLLTKRQDELAFLEWVSIIQTANICLAGTIYRKTDDQLLVWFKSAMNRNFWIAYEKVDHRRNLHSIMDLGEWVRDVSEIAEFYEGRLKLAVNPTRSAPWVNAIPNTSLLNRATPRQLPSGPPRSRSTFSASPPRTTPSAFPTRTTSTHSTPLAPAPNSSLSHSYPAHMEIYNSLPPHVPRPPPLTKPWHDYLLANKGCYRCRGIFVHHLSKECDMEKNIHPRNWSRMLSIDECAPLLQAWKDRRRPPPRVDTPVFSVTKIATSSSNDL